MTIILKIKFIALLLIIDLYTKKIVYYLLFRFTNIDKYFIRSYNYTIKYNLNHTLRNADNNILYKNLSKINEIFLFSHCRFGNCIIYLNNYICLCEIIRCKFILLNENDFWFIRNNITLENNITIKVGNEREFTEFTKGEIYFNNIFNIKLELKILFLKEEIMKNIPKIKISKKNLYIHIRSDDIFKLKKIIFKDHIQPPLCFYLNILKFFKFQSIYIISSDKGNPNINKLINYYPNILFKINNIKEDISILLNAYNLVGSISSFFISILQLNYNINFLWDYNICGMKFKNIVFHYDIYKYPNRRFIIYRMEPSNIYKNGMQTWKNNKRQIKLMIKDKCINNFSIILYK